MQIHQFNVSFDERQDRLLLRVNTHTGEEFRFWLTRRMALRLVPGLERTVARFEAAQPQVLAPDPVAQQTLTELKHEAFLQKADLQTPYVAQARQLPLGDAPMLLTEVQLHQQGEQASITLIDQSGDREQRCQLSLPTTMLHGLMHLIRQGLTHAQWSSPEPNAIASATSDTDTQNQANLSALTPPAGGYRH